MDIRIVVWIEYRCLADFSRWENFYILKFLVGSICLLWTILTLRRVCLSMKIITWYIDPNDNKNKTKKNTLEIPIPYRYIKKTKESGILIIDNPNVLMIRSGWYETNTSCNHNVSWTKNLGTLWMSTLWSVQFSIFVFPLLTSPKQNCTTLKFWSNVLDVV